jgi:microsomal dipeptidase-like Zn-dependent dipeptidase
MRARSITRLLGGMLAASVLLGPAAAPAPGAGAAAAPGPVSSAAALAGGCFALAPAGDRRAAVAVAGPSGYRVLRRAGARAAAFSLKATGPGTYLLYDQGAQLMGVARGAVGRVGGAELAGPPAEWAVLRRGPRTFALASTLDRRLLATAPAGGGLVLASARRAGSATRFALLPRRGCTRFPEAETGASGRSFSGTRPDGTVLGFADTHLHITADQRAGGRVIHGEPFDRFGIARALGGDARDHGADGSLDVTGNLLRTGLPFGTHSTQGWPAFTGWPVHDTNTHQQAYWVWLERAWKAGLRVVVAQTVEDDELCRIEPLRAHSCDEPHTIALEVRRLRELQAYVDAQAGGPGRGFLRLVSGPREARRVIERGKLAVVIGIESSNPFGCSLRPGTRRCTRADVDRGVASLKRLGVRSLFLAHWFDNAFAGAALEGATKGKFINAMNRLETGRYFATARCPAPGEGEEVEPLSVVEMTVLAQFFPATSELLHSGVPVYPPGPQCNARGLTPLGAYLVRRLMAAHVLIEVDHLSERARDSVLALARKHHYPVISSHNGTGGSWTPSQLRRLSAVGGLASVTPGTAPELVAKILRQARYRTRGRVAGIGIGTDTGGFSSLPGPRADAAAHPLRYPFRAYAGGVTFRRERTGTRVFDLNTDGVAQYGLMADLIADMRRVPHGRRALALLFSSAEAYLEMWQRSGARG